MQLKKIREGERERERNKKSFKVDPPHIYTVPLKCHCNCYEDSKAFQQESRDFREGHVRQKKTKKAVLPGLAVGGPRP